MINWGTTAPPMTLLLGFFYGFYIELWVLGKMHRRCVEQADERYDAMKAERDLFQGELIKRAARLEERLGVQ